MYTGKTLFAQLMDFLPWTTFARIVERYSGDRYVKSLRCAEHFRVMAFALLTYRESLRDIEACLSAQASKLYHMGFREPIRRSTLSDANEARGWRIYADFAQVLIRQVRKLYAAESFGVEPSDRLRARLDHNRSVPVGFPVGAFSRHQGCREDAYAARSARCDPELHSRLGRKIARRQSSRPPFDALAIFWWCTGLIPNFLCDSLPRIIAPSRACAREGRRHAPLRGWYVSGWLRTLAGQYDAAIEHLETSSRLSPRGYLAAPRYALGMAHFFSRHFAMLSLSVREVSFPGAYQPLASCYARMGRLEEARAVVERLRR